MSFFRENYVLVVGIGLPAFFLTVAYVGPRPPPRPMPEVTLSATDRQFITETLVDALKNKDAGPCPNRP